MKLKFCTYTQKQKKANFYIQRHGTNAGRPTKEPIRNCFAVYTDNPNAYKIFYAMYRANIYHYYLHGTCQRFINITNLKDIIRNHYKEDADPLALDTIIQVDLLLKNLDLQIQKYKQIQIGLSKKILSK